MTWIGREEKSPVHYFTRRFYLGTPRNVVTHFFVFSADFRLPVVVATKLYDTGIPLIKIILTDKSYYTVGARAARSGRESWRHRAHRWPPYTSTPPPRNQSKYYLTEDPPRFVVFPPPFRFFYPCGHIIMIIAVSSIFENRNQYLLRPSRPHKNIGTRYVRKTKLKTVQCVVGWSFDRADRPLFPP